MRGGGASRDEPGGIAERRSAGQNHGATKYALAWLVRNAAVRTRLDQGPPPHGNRHMLLRISQETGVRAQRRMGPCRIRRRQEYQFIGPTPFFRNRDEELPGTDPKKADTNSNGLGDGIEFRGGGNAAKPGDPLFPFAMAAALKLPAVEATFTGNETFYYGTSASAPGVYLNGDAGGAWGPDRIVDAGGHLSGTETYVTLWRPEPGILEIIFDGYGPTDGEPVTITGGLALKHGRFIGDPYMWSGECATGSVTRVAGSATNITWSIVCRPYPGYPDNAPNRGWARWRIRYEPDILKVDLDIDGVADADEETTGAVVVRRHDDNDAPRKKIILRQVEPTAWSGDVLLSRGNTKVKVFDAETGGTEITFNGTDNKFASTALPKDLWVQGDTASAATRDVPLDLSVDGLADCKDSVNFTVLWVDVDKRTTGNVSDDNAGKAEYIDRTGADGFGFRIYNLAGALGVEFVGTVHPSDFDQNVVFRRKFIASKEYSNGTLRSSDLDERMDTSDAEIRDDDPQSGDSEGTVYDLDAPGVLILAENPGDTDSRRVNFKQWTTYTVGEDNVRCSQERPWYLRINVKMKPDYTFELFDDVEGDNKIDFGTTSLEYNLE